MNNRTRQWFKASQMLDRVDPFRIGYRRDDKKHAVAVIFRQSELDDVKKEYGEEFVLIDSRDEQASL